MHDIRDILDEFYIFSCHGKPKVLGENPALEMLCLAHITKNCFYILCWLKKTLWSESASELYRPSDHRLSAKWLPTFCGERVPRGQPDGSLLPYSQFSRQEPLLFYQVAPQLYSGGWVDPVPDPLLFFGSAGSRTWASVSVAKNSATRPQRRSLCWHSKI
jgi:hypothetical protein